MFRDEHGLRMWVVVLLCVLAVLLVFGLIGSLACLDANQTCRVVNEQTGLPTHWEFWGGCFVTVGDRTVPLDTWRLMEVR